MTSADLVARLEAVAACSDRPYASEVAYAAKLKIEALEARLAEAMAVLNPFAETALDMDTRPGGYPWRDDQHLIRGIKAGDLRAARRLVEKEGGL